MSNEDERPRQAQDMLEGIPFSSRPGSSLQVSWAHDDLSYPTTPKCCPRDSDKRTKQNGTD